MRYYKNTSNLKLNIDYETKLNEANSRWPRDINRIPN